MKVRQNRLSKLEEQYKNSPMALAREAIKFLCQDPIYEAASVRSWLATADIDQDIRDEVLSALHSVGEPRKIQPEDKKILEKGFENLPRELKNKLMDAGIFF